MHRSFRRALVACLAVSCVLAPTAGAGKPGTGGGGSATPRDPILFVHGWNSSSTTWNTFVSKFAADGWTSAQLNNWSYNTAQSNRTTAAQIQTKVDGILAATGATKVDIVTHSMGGLSSRYYVKFLGGDAKVDDWVSLGGPNHGTDFANWCFDTSCGEMRIGSAFLGELNAGDESPGAVSYRTWWSPCDEIINPDSSVAIAGATNTKTACLSHSDLHENTTVYGQVRDFVR